MTDIRCKRCRRLLMKGRVKFIEIKCPKCGYIQTIEGGESAIPGPGALRVPASGEDPESLAISYKHRRIKR